MALEWGSPPRMRGKVKAGDFTKDTFRITPAYAGKSALLAQLNGKH